MVKLKFKIFFTYFTFLILIISAGYFVRQEILSYRESFDKDNSTTQVIGQVNDILNQLYKSEAINKTPHNKLNKSQELKQQKLTDSIVYAIDSLQSTFVDTLLTQHLDSVKMLLIIKQSQLKQLSLYQSPNSIDSLYFKTIERLDTEQDSLAYNINITENSSVQYDSVYLKTAYTPVSKRNFWKRSKPLETVYDSTLQVTIRKQMVLDSLVNKVDVKDSIGNLLIDIISEFRSEIVSIEEKQKAQKDIIYNNYKDISADISTLIHQIKQEQLDSSSQQIEEQREKLNESFINIYILAAIAILIILFFIINIFRDITKSQRYKNDLEQAKSTIEEVLKNKEMMMHSLSHDIKSPLSSIMGFAHILSEKTHSEKDKKYLQKINDESVYIHQLIEDLHTLSKLEQGKLELNNTNTNLKSLLTEVFNTHHHKAKKKGLDYTYNIEGIKEENYFADTIRLKQILNNIISNALKYTPKGSVSITAKIDAVGEKTDGIKVVVSDTGLGINKEDMQSLFSSFNRGKAANTNIKGMGLGLSTTKHLLKLLDGDIKVESEANKGSQFTITFNLKKAPKIDENIAISNDLKGKTIWLVDDDQTLLEMMTATLNQTGAIIKAFSNPIEALHNYTPQCFDVLVTDIQMPGLNGNELLLKLKSRGNPSILAIATTGLKTNSTLFDPDQFFAVIRKPFLPNELKNTISKALKIFTEQQSQMSESDNGSLKSLLAFAEGNQELESMIITSFFESEDANIKMLEKYIATNDGAAIVNLAHKMLNIYRQIQQGNITILLEELEDSSLLNSDKKTYYAKATHTLKLVQEYIDTLKLEYATR
ncbi:ATP-binding response regulator [Saccharicrinis aurantiacus]|uniref:ATP-binding response regulator n=1 Tax=Saccharicrinis aurantiacus TaxID=1849719 RepID=UPI00094F6EFF|nr:hybrid sensor histidine kinase/response regulator [Saccharicrinis aurantiacus]